MRTAARLPPAVIEVGGGIVIRVHDDDGQNGLDKPISDAMALRIAAELLRLASRSASVDKALPSAVDVQFELPATNANKFR